MEWRFTPMNEHDAHTIAQWYYEDIYAFYDMDHVPEDREELLNPENWKGMYYSVLNECNELIGFFSFHQEHDTIIIGLGLRPDHTGKGLGREFVQAGLEFGKHQFRPVRFRLSVATFNQRAIRAYEQLGFTPDKVFMQQTNGGEYEFLQMTKPA
jgi:ribosomal-protein-alanine N-acetyltransferase